jgi:MFS transporter, FHS family, L-fucose permease
MKNNKYALAFGLITILFFLWGFASNLNPILIPHLKKACQLTDLQSAFIDSAFYAAYFCMAIPAGIIMNKLGYKAGIIAGLLLFVIGAFLFIPAANTLTYGVFLAGLFIIGSGLTLLETAANPYAIVLGEPEGAAFRINFAQSFNGLAAGIAPLLGAKFILTDSPKSDTDLAAMAPADVQQYFLGVAAQVKTPYLIIGLVVLAVAVLLYFSNLPEIGADIAKAKAKSIDFGVFRHSHVTWGVIAQFFYVGAQASVSAFFIRYLGKTVGMEEKSAAETLSYALFGFMAGRFIGTLLLRFFKANILLAIYAAINIALLAFIITVGGEASAWALGGVMFFMSIMFPTIFSLGVKGLGEETKSASSFLVMAIVGGAIFPPIMGAVSDLHGIQFAYIVPLICFIAVLYYGLVGHKSNKTEVA